jgi:hypothetical protein
MTNEEKLKAFYKRMERVTAGHFLAFLNAKNVTPICPMCGTDGEQLFDETHHQSLEDMTAGTSFMTYFRHTPVNPGDSDINYYYKMTCSHCGFITTHGVTPVLNWIDSLQSTNSGGDK